MSRKPKEFARDFVKGAKVVAVRRSRITAIRIANDLNTEEIAGSPMARNTLILLRQAIERDGLPVTATGNLSCLSHKPRWTPSPNASSSEPGVIVRSFLETGVTVRAPYSCSSVCQFEGTAPTGPGAG